MQRRLASTRPLSIPRCSARGSYFVYAARSAAALATVAVSGRLVKSKRQHAALVVRCAGTAGSPTLADFTLPALGGGTREKGKQGEPIEFSRFVGKVTLIQNVASL